MALQWHDILIPAVSVVLAVGTTLLTFKVKQVEISKDITNLDKKVSGLCKLVDTIRKEKASENYANDLARRIDKLDDEKVDEKLNQSEHKAIMKGQQDAVTEMRFGFTEIKKLIREGNGKD